MIKVTDYERIATVATFELGRIKCPKCDAFCNVPHQSAKFREWDCPKCGRGWSEVPDHVQTVAQAFLLED